MALIPRAAFAALLTTCQVVTGQPANDCPGLDFKGLPFGSSQEDARKLFLEASLSTWQCGFSRPGASEDMCISKGQTFANQPTRLSSFFYTEDQLTAVRVTLHSNAYPAVLAALRQKYGPPAKTTAGTAANLTGARLPSASSHWRIGRCQLQASLRESTMDEAEVVFLSHKELALTAKEPSQKKPDI